MGKSSSYVDIRIDTNTGKVQNFFFFDEDDKPTTPIFREENYDKWPLEVRDVLGDILNKVPELKEKKKAAAKVAAQKAKKTDEQVLKAVSSAIEKAVKKGVFESSADQAIFDKVATDLLDNEMEIKVLAAAELGKMANDAAVPFLMEAIGFDHPDLTSEIINSLISIGAPEAVDLFKGKVNDPKYSVRIGCLRGLYKLADDEDAVPLLTEALRDNHPEVIPGLHHFWPARVPASEWRPWRLPQYLWEPHPILKPEYEF